MGGFEAQAHGRMIRDEVVYTSINREEVNDWAFGPKKNHTGVVPNPMGWARQMAGHFGPENHADGGEGLCTHFRRFFIEPQHH